MSDTWSILGQRISLQETVRSKGTTSEEIMLGRGPRVGQNPEPKEILQFSHFGTKDSLILCLIKENVKVQLSMGSR